MLNAVSFTKRTLRPLRTFLGKVPIIPPSPGPPLPNVNWWANLGLIEKIAYFVACEKIEGDYLEFGVYKGQSFQESYNALKRISEQRIRDIGPSGTEADARERQAIWDKMRFFAFDSFEGLPELEGIDKDTRDFRQGQYAAGVDEFKQNVAAHGVPLDRVYCVPGWYDQTCTPATRENYVITKAAVVWVDCDLFHSTRSALDFITPIVQDGTIIVFEDWYNYSGNPRRGEQQAFAEWKETLHGFTLAEYQKEGPFRNSFIVSSL